MRTKLNIRFQLLLLAGFLLGAPGVFAQTAMGESSPWPRVRGTNGNTVTIYQLQVETWTKNSFTGRAAVELKLAGKKSEWTGVVWFAADGRVDDRGFSDWWNSASLT